METGYPWLDRFLVWGGALTLAAAVVALLWRAVRGTVRVAGKVETLVDDWTGEEARPGVAARPGVMERVGVIEERVERIERELHPEGGTSLRAAVDLANSRLARLCDPGGEGHEPPPAAP